MASIIRRRKYRSKNTAGVAGRTFKDHAGQRRPSAAGIRRRRRRPGNRATATSGRKTKAAKISRERRKMKRARAANRRRRKAAWRMGCASAGGARRWRRLAEENVGKKLNLMTTERPENRPNRRGERKTANERVKILKTDGGGSGSQTPKTGYPEQRSQPVGGS